MKLTRLQLRNFIVFIFLFGLTGQLFATKNFVEKINNAIEKSDIPVIQELLRSPDFDQIPSNESKQLFEKAKKVLEDRKKILKIPVELPLLKKYASTIAWANIWCDRLLKKALPMLEEPQDDTSKFIQLVSSVEHPDWSEQRVLLVTGIFTSTVMAHNCKKLASNLFDKIASIENAQQMVTILEDRVDYSVTSLARTS